MFILIVIFVVVCVLISQVILLHNHLEKPSDVTLPTGGPLQMPPMKVVVRVNQTAVTEGFPGGSSFSGGCS